MNIADVQYQQSVILNETLLDDNGDTLVVKGMIGKVMMIDPNTHLIAINIQNGVVNTIHCHCQNITPMRELKYGILDLERFGRGQ